MARHMCIVWSIEVGSAPHWRTPTLVMSLCSGISCRIDRKVGPKCRCGVSRRFVWMRALKARSSAALGATSSKFSEDVDLGVPHWSGRARPDHFGTSNMDFPTESKSMPWGTITHEGKPLSTGDRQHPNSDS